MSSEPSPKRRTIIPKDASKLSSLLSSTNAAIIEPGNSAYNASIARWSMAASKPAGIVIQPTSNAEISIVLKYVSENNVDLAVRGGGHSTAGASSTDGGLLVDLSKMRGVDVADWTEGAGQKVFRIQGGANWGDVDATGHQHGLHTVEGTVADTGVGGLTLGGGEFMRSHGICNRNVADITK